MTDTRELRIRLERACNAIANNGQWRGPALKRANRVADAWFHWCHKVGRNWS